jgi:hypothetical protein
MVVTVVVGPDAFWEREWGSSLPFEATNLCLRRRLVRRGVECQLTVSGVWKMWSADSLDNCLAVQELGSCSYRGARIILVFRGLIKHKGV